MKKLILIFTIALFSVNAKSQGLGNYVEMGLFAPDKLLHLSAGYVITSTTVLALRAKGMPIEKAMGWGFGSAFVIGLGKELYDNSKSGNKFDEEDLLTTMLGSLVSNVTIAICWGDVEIKPFKKYRPQL
tara:strand:- start:6642 stop:7028 length:387 start_codon:yes stop_codon:yes gene_type:complete